MRGNSVGSRNRDAAAALLVAAIGVAGCGAANGSGIRDGRLHVTAVEGPTCPVQRVGSPPCVASYHGRLEVFDSSGVRIAEFTTSAAGTANLSLPAGTYTVTAPAPATGLPRLTQTSTVTVTASATVNLRLEFDTGIR
jgi:hypothetical protein